MKKGFLLALLLTFAVLTIPAFAVEINASEDTFVADSSIGILSYDLSGNVNHSSSSNYGNLSEATIFITKSGGGDGDVRTFVKFFNQRLQSRIITRLTLNYRVAEADCGVFSSNLFFQPDDTWNESTLTYNNMPALSGSALQGINSTGGENALVLPVFTGGSTKNSSDFYTSTFSQANANLFDDVYNNQYTSVESFKTGTCGGILGNKATIATKEGNLRNISLVASVVDFVTSTGTVTDVTGSFYYDFETGYGSFSSFPQADFSWNGATNVLTPVQPAILALVETDNTNTLSLVSCSAYAPFSTSNIGTLNVPTGSYSIVCFDLKNAHSGNQFYGAIKIFNNTNVRNGILSGSEFDFYASLYSSDLASFSPASFTPSTPEASRNLTVTWTTSKNLTTGMRFRYLQNGIFTAFATLENSTQSTSHQVVIPSTLMFATLYDYQLYGTDVNGTTFTTQAFNFTAIGTFTTGTSSNINISYFDFATGTRSATFFTGADFALDTISNISEFYSSGILWNGTVTPFVPKSFITFESTNTNTLQSQDCRLAPSYSLARSTYLNPDLQSGAYPVFCFDLGGGVFGAIKITQMIENGNSSFYWAVYSPSFVTFFGIVKSPAVPKASQPVSILWQTSLPMTSQMQFSYRGVNETGYNAFKLLSDTTAFRTAHGLTISSSDMVLGEYQFFFTGTDANNNTYTSTMFNFSSTNQTASGAISNPVANILGIDVSSALMVIALVVTIFATIFVQLKTKNAPVSAMTFMTFLMIFTAMSWLPIIFAIVLGILAVFIAIKFLADTVAGQQGT